MNLGLIREYCSKWWIYANSWFAYLRICDYISHGFQLHSVIFSSEDCLHFVCSSVDSTLTSAKSITVAKLVSFDFRLWKGVLTACLLLIPCFLRSCHFGCCAAQLWNVGGCSSALPHRRCHVWMHVRVVGTWIWGRVKPGLVRKKRIKYKFFGLESVLDSLQAVQLLMALRLTHSWRIQYHKPTRGSQLPNIVPQALKQCRMVAQSLQFSFSHANPSPIIY